MPSILETMTEEEKRSLIVGCCYEFSVRLLASPGIDARTRNEIIRIRDNMMDDAMLASKFGRVSPANANSAARPGAL